jgi:hypothetical protein
MPGYEIFEQKYLKPFRENGIDPYDTRIGFMDFLREIRTGVDTMPRRTAFHVVGIDEALFMVKPDDRQPMAREIHRILQSGASAMERRLIQVQIVCKGKLIKGDTLYLEYRSERLPIDHIFATTITHDIGGIPVYKTGFNLST